MKIYTLLALIGMLVLCSACGFGPWGRRACCPTTCAQYVQPTCETATYPEYSTTCPEYSTATTAEYSTAGTECSTNGGTYTHEVSTNGSLVEEDGEFEDLSAGEITEE